MRNKIHKYNLEITDHQRLVLKDNTRILSVGQQDGRLVVWAEVDTNSPDWPYHFDIVGTGNPVHPAVFDSNYIGTVKMPDGLVWHVYGHRRAE